LVNHPFDNGVTDGHEFAVVFVIAGVKTLENDVCETLVIALIDPWGRDNLLNGVRNHGH
jgi:hypothetical protein